MLSKRRRVMIAISEALALLVLVLIVIVAGIAAYMWIQGMVSSAPAKPTKIYAMAIIESVAYYEHHGIPILSVYIRNIGAVPLTPSAVYVTGSPLIMGKPRKYNVTTKVETVHRVASITGQVQLEGKEKTVRYWKTVVSGLRLENVWGGDEWTINLGSSTASRSRRGLVCTGSSLTWSKVWSSNARGDVDDRGNLVIVTCRSINGFWATFSYRAALPRELRPPFVVEVEVEKEQKNYRDSDVVVYLTSKAGSNPFYCNPFYEFGVFRWYADVHEARLRNRAGDYEYFSADVEASKGHLALIVEQPGVGELHGYYSEEKYGSTSFSLNDMNYPMKYVWFTVETKQRYKSITGRFWKSSLKIYRRPNFTLVIHGPGGTVELYNVSLVISSGSKEAKVFYVNRASEKKVVVDPRDSASTYLLWLEHGYPFNVTVSISVFNASRIIVEPRLNYTLTLRNIEVKVIDPPEDFNSSKISVKLENPEAHVVEWSIKNVKLDNEKVMVEVSVIVGNVSADLVVLYNGTEIARRTVEVPVYREYVGQAVVSYSGGDVEVEVPVNANISYDEAVLVDACIGERMTAGVGEAKVTLHVGLGSTSAEVWRERNEEHSLNDVYGGDEYLITWTGSSWSLQREATGEVLKEGFSSGWKDRWELRTKNVDAGKYEEGGWGGIEAKRKDSYTWFPGSSLVRRISADAESLVIEGRLWKKDYMDPSYSTGLFLADQKRADPWSARNWIMCRIYRAKGIQVGVSRNGDRKWSTKIYGRYEHAAFVLLVSDGHVEYWVWPSSGRAARPKHGVLTGAPELKKGKNYYVHLSHVYYKQDGSVTRYRYSLFDDIVVYKGTKIRFKLKGSSSARINRVVFKDLDGSVVYEWYPASQDDAVTLDLNSWYLRDYWLRTGCPLALNVSIAGERKESVSVDVNVTLSLRVRVFANFTLTGYDPELVRKALTIKASVEHVDASLEGVDASSVGGYVRVTARVKVNNVKVRVKAYLEGKEIYEGTVELGGKVFSATTAVKASSEEVHVDLVVPAYLEKDVTSELSGGAGSPIVEVGSKEDALRIEPGEAKKIEFVLSEPLLRDHWYKVTVAFNEGITASYTFKP